MFITHIIIPGSNRHSVFRMHIYQRLNFSSSHRYALNKFFVNVYMFIPSCIRTGRINHSCCTLNRPNDDTAAFDTLTMTNPCCNTKKEI